MNYMENEHYDMYKGSSECPGPTLMGADTLVGNSVYNTKGEDLGDIKDIMLNVTYGKVTYAVLEFGGFLGMGEKLFAVPWDALKLDSENKRFTLNIDKERLENAPSFDKDYWPNMADETWAKEINAYYGTGSGTSSNNGSGEGYSGSSTPDHTSKDW